MMLNYTVNSRGTFAGLSRNFPPLVGQPTDPLIFRFVDRQTRVPIPTSTAMAGCLHELNVAAAYGCFGEGWTVWDELRMEYAVRLF